MRRDALLSFATGPVPAYPAVLRAMSAPIPYDHDAVFRAFFHDLTSRVGDALRSAEPPVILQMEAAPGLEACLASLIAPADTVLSVASGPYGAALGTLARRHARHVVDLAVAAGEAATAAAVAAILRQRPEIGIVTVVHHETVFGTVNPIAEIADVARRAGAIVLVDAVSSFGGMDIDATSSGADVFITSPGKCLGGTPGLTLVAVTRAAWDRIAHNPSAPRGSVTSLWDWREAWRPETPFPFTPSIAELHGLAAAIDLYLAEGPHSVWARHAHTAAVFRAGIRALGLRMWAAEERILSPTCSVVRLPAQVAAASVLAEARALGVVFAPGRGEAAESTVRVGHMGGMAEPLYGAIAAAVLGEALCRCGAACDPGQAAAAALALSQA